MIIPTCTPFLCPYRKPTWRRPGFWSWAAWWSGVEWIGVAWALPAIGYSSPSPSPSPSSSSCCMHYYYAHARSWPYNLKLYLWRVTRGTFSSSFCFGSCSCSYCWAQRKAMQQNKLIMCLPLSAAKLTGPSPSGAANPSPEFSKTPSDGLDWIGWPSLLLFFLFFFGLAKGFVRWAGHMKFANILTLRCNISAGPIVHSGTKFYVWDIDQQCEKHLKSYNKKTCVFTIIISILNKSSWPCYFLKRSILTSYPKTALIHWFIRNLHNSPTVPFATLVRQRQ